MEENAFIRELTDTTARSKNNTERIEKLEKRQDNLDKLATAMATFDAEQKHIKEDVSEIKSDVKSLTEKPAKRWDNIVEKIIWLVLAALIGYALASLGINV